MKDLNDETINQSEKAEEIETQPVETQEKGGVADKSKGGRLDQKGLGETGKTTKDERTRE